LRIPLISIKIDNRTVAHFPGDSLKGEYQIDAVDPDDLRAVELAVLWYTEGKGDEDLGVHSFERRTTDDDPTANLVELQTFDVQLPNSPLSYEGVLIKIRWCVRVRIFLKSGKTYSADSVFQLGNVPDAVAILKSGSGESDHAVAGTEGAVAREET